ncbi:hypothetical protein V6Z11_D11G024700 [Gossypium hirsutum]
MKKKVFATYICLQQKHGGRVFLSQRDERPCIRPTFLMAYRHRNQTMNHGRGSSLLSSPSTIPRAPPFSFEPQSSKTLTTNCEKRLKIENPPKFKKEKRKSGEIILSVVIFY